MINVSCCLHFLRWLDKKNVSTRQIWRFLFASFDVNCIVQNSCKIEQKVPVVLDNSYSGEEVPLSPKFGVLAGAPFMSGC